MHLDQRFRRKRPPFSAYIGRGYAYGKKREYDRAIADFEKAIELVDLFVVG